MGLSSNYKASTVSPGLPWPSPRAVACELYSLDIKASKGMTETTALQREGEAEQAGDSL